MFCHQCHLGDTFDSPDPKASPGGAIQQSFLWLPPRLKNGQYFALSSLPLRSQGDPAQVYRFQVLSLCHFDLRMGEEMGDINIT